MVNLSLIVALYNTVDYLPNFFKCLENQTFQDFEVIIVDDMSTDGSCEFVDEYKKHSKLSINFIKSKEKLLPDLARKKAFEMCEGKYILSLDSDDEFSDDYLQSLYEMAIKNDLDYAVSSCQKIDENGIKMNKKRLLSKRTIEVLKDKEKKILIRGRYGGWNRMVKKSFLVAHGYDYLSGELPLFIMQFDINAKVGYTTKGVYYYRERRNSVSRSNVPQRILDYDVLEPVSWYKNTDISKTNKKVLGLYLWRMILPYIYYKKFADKSYVYKKDIKYVKKQVNYSFAQLLKYYLILDSRDKFISAVFALRLHFVAFYFIKKHRK